MRSITGSVTLAPYLSGILILSLLLVMIPGSATYAGTIITVDTTNDELNSDGDCSLREAIQAANTDSAVDNCPAGSGADTIILPTGTYTLDLIGPSENGNATGDLDVLSDIQIDGAGTASTIIDGFSADRVFHIGANATSPTVDLSLLTIQNGNATPDLGGGVFIEDGDVTFTDVTIASSISAIGGGLAVGGTAHLSNSRLTKNHAQTFGGGLNNNGTVTLENSLVQANSSGSNRGGGIHNSNGIMTILNSVVNGNVAQAGNGGGIANFTTSALLVISTTVEFNQAAGRGGGISNQGALTIINSTISSNAAETDGGGLYNLWTATAQLYNVTIANNIADEDEDGSGEGGGIYEHGGTLDMANSILAGNADPTSDPDCYGTFNSLGYNLIGVVSSNCTISGTTTGNLTGQPPLLGPLADNGGPNRTHKLLLGSPAIDGGDPAGCLDSTSNPLTIDQRGSTRPLDGDGDGTAICDMGAYEAEVSLFLPLILK